MDRLRFSFSVVGADAFLVSHLPNIRYLCGFTGSAALLLVEQSSATLFTDSRYTFQAREEVSNARLKIARAAYSLPQARRFGSAVGACGQLTTPLMSP